MGLMSATSDQATMQYPDASLSSGEPPPVDASMRLLREVMAQPVDPAYAMAARRRAAGVRSGWVATAVTVILALVGGWVVTRGIGELRRPEPGQDAGRAVLEREITRRSAYADAQQGTIERVRAEIAAAQQAQLTSARDVELADRVRQLALVAGEVPVTGPGLQVTLDDAPSAGAGGAVVDPRAPSGVEDGRVYDRDVQIAVNGLWAAGAEAVAINGRRLTALSAIRSAGQAILVDFRPLVPPYVISAVGDPEPMRGRFTTDNAGSYLQGLQDNYHVDVRITAVTQLRLPGAGTFALRLARPVLPAGPSSSSSSPQPSRPLRAASSPSLTPSTEVSP